jgi:hypothetical protein
MSSEKPRGGPITAFLGESRAVYRQGEQQTDATLEKPATLEDALQDAANHAVAGGYRDQDLRVVHIEFRAGNPHIKELRVIVTPGG